MFSMLCYFHEGFCPGGNNPTNENTQSAIIVLQKCTTPKIVHHADQIFTERIHSYSNTEISDTKGRLDDRHFQCSHDQKNIHLKIMGDIVYLFLFN